MAQQFWVNNYYIDVTRNLIQHQQQATQLPPKALKVLEVLASRAGEVVSHDELMDLVWDISVVGPNSLQRAIAQLRKAFGDDSKQQAFIKTHAKKGYSLEASVRWEEKPSQSAAAVVQPAATQNTVPGNRRRTWLVAAVVLVASVSMLLKMQVAPQQYDQLTPITASDEQEFNASYSPDGKYLIFNRYEGQCVSHLWAKDLANNQEVRLSQEPGHYSGLSWSTDGSQVALILQSDCEAEIDLAQQCWQLQTLDFARAWNGEPNSAVRFDCEQIQTSHPTWLNDGRIALLQYPSTASSGPDVMIHDARIAEVTKVPLDHSGKIYSLAYSSANDLFASVALDDNNQHILRTFTVDGEIKSQALIERLPQHSVYGSFPISFAPDGEHFLASPGGQIHRLSLDGKLRLIHSDSLNGLSNPIYHPDQTKIAATQGTKDFDVGFLNATGSAAIDVIARSTETDINAQFQPNGELIAFASYRSGSSQLWIFDGQSTYQLTQFDDGMEGLLYSWSPDGQQLVVNLNNQLAIVELDGNYRVVDSPIAVNYIVPWTHPKKLLVIANRSSNDQLFSIDLQSGEATDTGLNNVLWAAYTEDNHILYANNQKRFFRVSEGQTTALSTIDGRLFGKRAVLAGSQIYGIDAQHQLWRYDTQTDDFAVITTTNKDIIYVSSIQDGQMLATQFVGGQRELVELSAY